MGAAASSFTALEGQEDELDDVGSQIVLSYQIVETGAKELGGDGTVMAMKAFLQSQGYTVFVGDSSGRGGETLGQRVQDDAVVVGCSAFIAICSPTYGATEWTFNEFQLADNKKKPILPVWHSGPYPPPKFERFLRGRRRVPHGHKPLVECDFGDSMQQLLASLRREGCLPPNQQQTPRSLSLTTGKPLQQHLEEAADPSTQWDEGQQQAAAADSTGPAAIAAARLQQQRKQPTQGTVAAPRTPSKATVPMMSSSRKRVAAAAVPASSESPPSALEAELPFEELCAACLDGDLPTLQRALAGAQSDKAAVANQARKDGSTPLHIAASSGHVEVTRLLLNAGANKDAADKDGGTPLQSAAGNGHVDTVRALLRAGANKEAATKDGGTPLHRAAWRGYVEVVETLLRAGVNKEAADKDGWTPLHSAAGNGHVLAVQALLQAGADKEAAVKDGWTPLHIAAGNGHVGAVKVLLQAGANKEAVPQDGRTPLHRAASRGYEEVVWALVEAGANMEATDKEGWTPLLIAAGNGHLEAVRALLQAGANKEAAVQAGRVMVFPTFVSAGHPMMFGKTPLHIAAINGRVEVVGALLEAGANMEAADKNGATPLYEASVKGDVDVVRRLLKAGANMEAANKERLTPLRVATKLGHVEVVRELTLAMAAEKQVRFIMSYPPCMGDSSSSSSWFESDLGATDGLGVHELELPLPESEGGSAGDAARKMTFSLWDFGGQALAPGAPMVLVGTHAGESMEERAGGEFRPRRPPASLTSAFPSLYREPLFVSSKTGSGIEQLKEVVLQLALNLKGVGDLLPESFVKLRRAVQAEQERFPPGAEPIMALSRFQQLAAHTGVTDPSLLQAFILLLTDFGDVLHFEHVPGLEDAMVLRPQWLADVMAHAITLLGEVSPNHAEGLLTLLENFSMMHSIDKDTALVPPLLPDLSAARSVDIFYEKLQSAEQSPGFPRWRCWAADYVYSYAPDALLCRLLCRVFALPNLEVLEAWRFGAVMRRNGHLAMIAEAPGMARNVVHVMVCGPKPENLGCLVSAKLKDLLAEAFPGVKLEDISYSCPRCVLTRQKQPGAFKVKALQKKIARREKVICETCDAEGLDLSGCLQRDDQAEPWRPAGPAASPSSTSAAAESTLQHIMRMLGKMSIQQKRDSAKRELEHKDLQALIIGARAEGEEDLIRRVTGLAKMVAGLDSKPLPALHVVLPMPSGKRPWWDRKGLVKARFRLHLLCKHPGGPHLTDHEGYEIERPAEWLRRRAPAVRLLTHSMGLLLGAGVKALTSGGSDLGLGRLGELVDAHVLNEPLEAFKKLNDLLGTLEEEDKAMSKVAAAGGEGKGGTLPPLPPLVPPAAGSSSSGQTTAVWQAQHQVDIANSQEARREIEALVRQQDPIGNYGNLQKIKTRAGDVLWLCKAHAEEHVHNNTCW
ncbi:hypothetical protein GPECTOR_13g662 [Gonium pectorale]|uniref:Uncharacterized protein n=1 Tax=Gonium pectorale TaxID=33097 RepID=A0A150GN22_GONPE|nr:hypothetical protein GPECTOR_13g662 [Gonium pectorale]|eukprot:KXZ51175.1 hypothetical protein GPECTOR_13g662 [Gonium pectorale]